MAIPQSVNFDFMVRAVLGDIEAAIKAWTLGQPRSEEALLNQLTGAACPSVSWLRRWPSRASNRHCLVASLHRKGTLSTDKYGADLAVTVRVDNDRYMKTALFQSSNVAPGIN